MHPALMIAVMEERDREIARRTKNAWKRPSPEPRRTKPARQRGRGRLYAAFARTTAAFFG